MEPARSLKVVFIGNAGVGKTLIISGKCMGSFQPPLRPTLGSDHHALDVRVDGKVFSLHIWDTAGQEMYSSLVFFYLRDCDVACTVSSASIYQLNLFVHGAFTPVTHLSLLHLRVIQNCHTLRKKRLHRVDYVQFDFQAQLT
jgi:GTPase SAR1 family protein